MTDIQPHVTGVQIWDVPSTVILGSAFKVTVGVRCSAGCNLKGQEIAVYDYEGERVATAKLGDAPDGAPACAEIEIKAPAIESRYAWEVRFLNPDLPLEHLASAGTFALGVAGQPDHVVTVRVVDQETQTPLANATVILRPSVYRGTEYSNRADASGVASVRVPKGEYHVCATSPGYRSFLNISEVAGDLAVQAELITGSDLDNISG